MRTTLLLLFAFILTACGSQPKEPAATEQSAYSNSEQIQLWLTEAQTAASPRREQLRLKAAALLLREEQKDLADQIITKIQPEKLPLTVFAQYVIVRSKLDIQRGLYLQAQASLQSPRLLENNHALSQKTQLTLSLLQAETYALLGNHLASAQQRIYIDPLLNSKNQLSNREAIWNALMNVAIADLERDKTSNLGAEYIGWLELALIAKANQGDLEQQVKQLDNWQKQWAQHPANNNLPGGLQLIRQLTANRPQQIALLLPVSGKLAPLGKAVRDGFIAAMYETSTRGGTVPLLKVYDTEASDDFMALYQQAVAEGAQMIVGPLEKYRLSLLFEAGNLPVPTLALNRIDDYGNAPSQLYQFGLAPQDEARQIADIAFLENHRQAFIIAPQGEWGDKTSQAFIERWQELGGQAIAQSTYQGQQDYSSSIKQSLLLQESESRAKRIERLIGEHIEFFPRRREDIDMVLILARPQEARSINPLLAYHYAGDLPVYATSRVYDGYDNIDKDRDLNGIRFTDMPWVLNKPSELHQQIDNELKQSKPYQRMYALGIDSFQLYPRLKQLQLIPTSRVYGQTGTLSLNQRNEIERQMLLAKMANSKAKLIPIAGKTINLDLPSKDGFDNDKETKQ
ncbi:MAG: penicillin-binding protein activator [Spongiibacteraceae bacterium]